MQQQSKTRRRVLTLTGGALAALAGCGGGDGGAGGANGTAETDMLSPTETETGTETETETETEAETESETTTASGDALLRVAHLSPDAPNVDVAVDGETVLSDVPFGAVSDYLTLSPGEYQVTITPTGGDEAVFDETVPVESGRQTAAAIGEVSGENQSFGVSLIAGESELAESGSARARAVHAIPDAPAVDVTAGDAVLADGLAFGEASEYATVPADTAELQLRPDNESNDADPVGAFEISLTDRAVHSVFAAGYLEPSGDQPGARLVVATDAAPEGMGTETGTGSGTEAGTETTTASN
ncbi:DUF4397 domain-containing protein [Haloarcula marina]|uniref:DUF4397 domain-containing protein n=1 Tax=Haloarcula marina TaxID=2961574 RepID=UPI0020B6E846|nr:DUF4397 domain-containing protein [Halomicroarcula marina]